jgi:maleate isomerase
MRALPGNDRSGGRLGMIVPSSNSNLEPDCALLVPAGVTTHFTRMGGYDIDKIPDAGAMQDLAMTSVDGHLDLLMDARVDVIGYGCASATLSCGWDFDRDLKTKMETRAGIPVVTVAGAMVEAIRNLKISRIGFTSPYVSGLNIKACGFFADAGIDVVHCADLGAEISSIEQGLLTPAEVFDLGCAADHPQAEAIVIGCTDFRAVEAIDALQGELGKPVITSNQALVLACLERMDSNANKTESGDVLLQVGGRYG